MFCLIRKACFYFLLGFTFILCLGLLWRHFATPFLKQGETTFIVTPHMTLKTLAKALHDGGLLSHPQFFILLGHLRGDAGKLRSGEYAITSKTTPDELLTNIARGNVVMRKVTLAEGITLVQIRQIFFSSPGLVRQASLETDSDLMKEIGHPGESPEGRFFPDTYLYTWGNKDTVILQQAYKKMENVLAREWSERDGGLPYKTPEEGLIAASLVESEAEIPEEREKIAGVIVRRLQKWMPLQVDPAVLYGVGKPFGSEITREDLHNNNPYNTYLHYGLPPTPINMPGEAAIHAAMHPAPGDALYYVSQGNGSHQFSATYADHLKAVQKYRDYEKSQKE